jgi:hypothetical protein
MPKQRSVRPYVFAALAAVVLGVTENVLFGRDTPGTAHDVSTAFFLLFLAGVLALAATGIVAVSRSVRRRSERRDVQGAVR